MAGNAVLFTATDATRMKRGLGFRTRLQSVFNQCFIRGKKGNPANDRDYRLPRPAAFAPVDGLRRLVRDEPPRMASR